MPNHTWGFGLLGVLSLFLFIGEAFAQPATQSTTLPTPHLLNRFGLTLAWWNQATINPSRDTVRHLTADEQIVFVQSSAGVVTAIDLETGRKLWDAQLGRKDAPSFAVTTNDELALVIAGLDMFAVDKWTGNLEWRFRIPSQPSASPAMDETQVYVATMDGSVYAADLKKIQELFELNLLPQWSYQTMNWRYKTAKTVRTPPIPWGSIVNFASEDKSLYSVTKEGRDLKFQLETDAPVSAPMSVSDGFLYMASEDFNVYAVNLISGNIRWQFVTGLPVHSAPQAIGQNLYVTPKRGGLYQLSTVSGRQRWWQPDLIGFVAESKNFVYGTNERGDLVVVDRATGGPLGTLPLKHYSVRVANDRTDRVILGTSTGLVIMLHERDQTFPMYHAFPENRPLVPEFAPEEEPAPPQQPPQP